MIKTKRVYQEAAKTDGYRVLIDRLWPRGVTKDTAAIDLWLKDIAPSPELRNWFGHKPELFNEFKQRYILELLNKRPLIKELEKIHRDRGTLTLVYAAKDTVHNHAIVLRDYLSKSETN